MCSLIIASCAVNGSLNFCLVRCYLQRDFSRVRDKQALKMLYKIKNILPVENVKLKNLKNVTASIEKDLKLLKNNSELFFAWHARPSDMVDWKQCTFKMNYKRPWISNHWTHVERNWCSAPTRKRLILLLF